MRHSKQSPSTALDIETGSRCSKHAWTFTAMQENLECRWGSKLQVSGAVLLALRGTRAQ
jgi:hypothetical protein